MKPVFFDRENGRQDRPFLIFVEGQDDGHFLDSLLEELNVRSENVAVIIVDGKDKFIKEFKSFKKSPYFKGVKGIALIRDADDNSDVTVQQSVRMFSDVFGAIAVDGQISNADGKRIGLFVLPGNNEHGDLERLCLSTVSGTPPEQLVTKFVGDAEILHGRDLSQKYKRTAQAYLSVVDGDLCRGAGMGFKKGLFNRDHESLASLKSFLNSFLIPENVVPQ